jgi:hypothetical protein
MKKLLFIILLLVLILTSLHGQVAAEVAPESSFFIKSATSIINSWGDRLSVHGQLHTFTTVDRVTVTSYLQYWNGSRWVDYLSWSNTRTSADYVNVYREVIPPKGYYYRVRSVHTAEYIGIRETVHSFTNFIYF